MTGFQLLDALKTMSDTELSYPVTIPAVDEEQPVGFEAGTILVARTAYFKTDGDTASGLTLYLE